MTAEDSRFDLIHMNTGHAHFHSCGLRNHRVVKKFIAIANAELVLDDFSAKNISIEADQLFIKSAKNSKIELQNSNFTIINTKNYELSEVTNSTILIANSVVAQYQATFMNAYGSKITIRQSLVEAGGLMGVSEEMKRWMTAGFLTCSKCKQIVVENSVFRYLVGNDGGVMSVENTQGIVSVTFSEFSYCRATRDGGVLKVTESTFQARNSSFSYNEAHRGAVLFFEATANVKAELTNCSFDNNAANEGAVVRWTYSRPVYTNVISKHNFAVYGDFEATLPHHLSLSDSASILVQGMSGMLGTTPVVVSIRDVLNQTIATENSTNVQISSEDSEAVIRGGTALSAEMGIISFSSIIVSAVPGSIVKAKAYTSRTGQLPDFLFLYSVRNCIAGELATPTGCSVCPKNTYSLDSDSTTCHFCKKGAMCLGGSSIVLDTGYWRLSNLTDAIFLCVQQKACEGGADSICSSSYEGRLCGRCTKGNYHTGTGYCSQCHSTAIHWTSVAMVAFALAVYSSCFIYLSVKAQPTSKSDTYLTILRNSINFFHMLLAFELVYIDWSYSATLLFYIFESFSSVTVSLWASPCFFGSRYSDFALPLVYVRAITSSALPVVLVLLCIAVSFLVYRMTASVSVLQASAQVQLILVYLSYPYALKSGLELVTCIAMESDTVWLRADLGIPCWDFSHYRMVISVFLPVAILYCFGSPLLFLLWFIRMRSASRLQSIRFLTAGFRDPFAYWELVCVLLKVALLVFVALTAGIGIKVQFVVATMLLYLFLSLLFFQQPCENAVTNALYKASIVLLIALCLAGYFRSPLANTQYDEVDKTLEVVVLLMSVGQVGITAGAIVSNYRRKSHRVATVYPIMSSLECNYSANYANPNPSLNSSFTVR